MGNGKEELQVLFDLLDLALRSGYDLETIAEAYVRQGEAANRDVIGSADANAIEYARENGYDVLTSNTSAVKSNTELRNGKPLWMGLASQCVAVAVIHRNVGIAGVHVVTVNRNDIKSGILRLLASGPEKFRQEMVRINEGGHEVMVASIVPPETRLIRVGDAVTQAATLYRQLSAGTGASGPPWVGITGMNYGSVEEQRQAADYARQVIDENFPGASTDIRIGLAGGVIYGGPQHPQFSRPAIVM
ncbi:hypothetical protein A2Z33_05910 [Candidatus Gottesmanbacteria bacterium RBG_16_52_11]|uniref:Uncharacterized protein n=1 Tax=Candidatus Gottesmanbacteria bacterium RBG_16_52_11 TaxID=1798374 RepID=A0A1F5YXY0_9BACT|nr:MAG: hypothetical protein A2Z33_05910 [Candidatus Gottesmanbacteria bacterium RBG_16_52_11]